MKTLKIGFNARVLSSPSMRGWARYAVNVIEQLRRQPVELFLYYREPLNPSLRARLTAPNVRFVGSPRSGPYLLWEQRWLADRCRRDGLDIFHSPTHFGLPYFAPCKRVITLHDALTVEKRTPKAFMPWLLQALARKAADAVITVSEFSKSELTSRLAIPGQKITVVPEAAESLFHEEPSRAELALIREKYSLAKPFAFYAGGWEGRKNIDFLIRSFLSLNMPHAQLVLVGGTEAEIARIRRDYPHADRIALFGKVPDYDLACLYRLARGFVYPSLLEGFGLQVVEAYSAACPVIGSNTTSLAEIIRYPAATFDPRSQGSCAGKLRALFDDDDFRTDLARHATGESARYSWEKTGEQTLALYRRILES